MSFILKSTILGANWVHLGSIRHGGDRKSDGHNVQLKTQSEDSPNGTKPKWGCGKFSTRQNEILLSIPKQTGNQYTSASSERLEKAKTKAETSICGEGEREYACHAEK